VLLDLLDRTKRARVRPAMIAHGVKNRGRAARSCRWTTVVGTGTKVKQGVT
jgi:hypothetical protein